MSKKKQTFEELLEEAIVQENDYPYEIPENWVWTKMGTVFYEVRNGTTLTQNKLGEGFPVTRIESVQNNLIERNRLGYISNEKLKEKDFYEQGDIVFSHINSYEHVGKTALIQSENLPMVHGMNLLRLRTNKTLFNPEYLQLFMQTHMFRMSVRDRVNRAVNQVSINQKMLNEVLIPCMPVSEQTKIVNQVSELQLKIDEAKHLIEQVKETFEHRRAAILDMAFSGELSEIVYNERNSLWNIVNLGSLILSGPQNGLYKPQTAYGEGNLIVRIDNFYNGNINDWATLKRLRLDAKEVSLYGLEEGDILVNRVNSIQYLGKSALVRNLPEDCVFESNVMRFKVNNDLIDNEYLILYLNSHAGLRELRKNAKHAVNQASINQTDVKNTIVPLPSLAEQKLIVEIVSKLTLKEKHALTFIKEQLNQIKILKQAILSKAFRGELGTNDPSEESAIELIKEILKEQVK
ncbi:restriction endonuclease subunit S [Cytobacillus firmus]|uniref:Restriction modification system DNA specificity domain-containing protein n=1 Tax=Cytobacillus firmus DS1 TaxID=1307436 RepID=W7L8U8_CYTFI|nr:restriction endonuclease subunit S [Cytobacillus firmus]EWG11616.1 restriction modification system DNA specificity domain-containing protein [Cytobacillus firmus DS1]